MSRRVLSLAAVFTLALTGAAFAQSKPVLDDGFAHIKHGQLFLCGNQGPQHSIGSHTGWAKGQSDKVVRKEIVSQILTAYKCLVHKTTTDKGAVVNGFAYIKQGALILTGKTGPQHSIGSHSGWANGQSDDNIRKAAANQLDDARKAIWGAL